MSAPRQHRGGAARRIAAAVCAFLLLLAIFAVASAAGSTAGCGGKPGSPNRGAVHQYCPSEVKKAAPAPSTGTSGDSKGTAEVVAPAPGSDGDGPGGAPGGAPEKAGPQIPLTDYPSSGGVNALLIAVLIAIAIGVAYGARRWRRGSAEVP
jgi:hypothetical protein